MRKLLTTSLLVSLAVSQLSADYMMVITENDGTEKTKCVKSYSFTSNPNSLSGSTHLSSQDVYSEEESLTNKTYMGKPVYRKVVTTPPLNPTYSWTKVNYINPPENIDTFISAVFIGVDYTGVSRQANNTWKLHYQLEGNRIAYTYGTDRKNMIEKRNVVVEYTKTTDSITEEEGNYNSYLEYILSSSKHNVVKTRKIYNQSVKFLQNYEYIVSTKTCVSN